MTVDDRLAFFDKNFDLMASGCYSRGDRRFISDGASKTVPFCKKDENGTTFNESHAIPECLEIIN